MIKLDNSSQPYLFTHNNVIKMLYCYANHSVSLSFGATPYIIRPWKIHIYDLNNQTTGTVMTPTSHHEYGDIIIECNPHLVIVDNVIKLYYTAGFIRDLNSPINYQICCLTFDNLNFETIENFEIVTKSFTGTPIDNETILCIDKVYQKDILISKNILSNTKTIINHEMDAVEILRITNIFNSDKKIITVKNSFMSYYSYFINADLSINKIITNNQGYNVYKCSILNNLLAYTIHNDSNSSEPESRSILIEEST